VLTVALNRALDEPVQILCLGAHCDDIEIGAGGTILQLLAERPGSTIRWVVFASTPDREREARASAEAFTAAAKEVTIDVYRFRESFFPYVAADIKEQFEAIHATIEPDVVLTHRREDEHQDHRTIAGLTWNTFRDHVVLEFEIPKYEGDLGHPNVYVDLPEPIAERKIELILEHFASQRRRPWFKASTFRGLMAVRGVECNASDGFAEAFHARKLVLGGHGDDVGSPSSQIKES
jgi:LmbE family N-acetylglucosaminyl deacetylase